MSFRALIIALICLLPLAGRAAESPPHSSPRNVVSLVSDMDSVAPGGAYHLGVRFQLTPGWHIYFRNPGDAGLPPEPSWTLAEGMRVGEIAWPAPQRLSEGELVTFGYTGSPMLVVPASGPGPVRVHLDWLVCNNICVPEEADLALDVASGPAQPSGQAGLFAEAASHVPVAAPFAARISPQGQLAVTGLGSATPREALFVADAADMVAAAPEQNLRVIDDGFTLQLTPASAFKPDAPVSGVLLLTDAGGQPAALHITAQPGAVAAGTGLGQALLAALLGGLILNLMPCVFPVLAMKAMAILRLSDAGLGAARREGLAYAAGVIVSFTAIGAAVLVLRRAGLAVGWGFQFQSPIFVAGMAWLLFGVGLNLSGVFEVSARVAGAGQSLTLRGGAAGSFFAGALAVLVATPCTAPFMSVALAVALTASAPATLALFAALGVGLAAPALLLAAFPGLARGLPRPGRWMDVVKQALAFPVYGASAWLVWVLATQGGADGVMLGLAGLLMVGFVAWLLHLGGAWPRRAALLGVLMLPVLAVLLEVAPAGPAQSARGEAFSQARLAELRAAHTPVFIDMTAAWCVTCLVNERVALDRDEVRDAFARRHVVTLVGDWTRQDAQITAFLREQGRDGVPLYVYYPETGAAVVLPQVLTPGLVLDAVGS